MDMGLKNALFDECLISDGWLVALSGTFVVLCMCFYTASVFITAMTIVAILFSLAVSYFIYVFIFELAFFPFMNILAVIVIVGKLLLLFALLCNSYCISRLVVVIDYYMSHSFPGFWHTFASLTST